MTAFIAAVAIVSLLAATLLVCAGIEFLRVHGFPPHRVHDAADLVHLAGLGYASLNAASYEAARRRMTGP